MINRMIEKVKQFLKDALEVKEGGESVKVVGIVKVEDGWVAEAEVVARSQKLPGHRVFDTKRYMVKLGSDKEIISYKQLGEEGSEEEE